VHSTPEQIAEIVGPEAMQRYGTWDRSIQGQYGFKIAPDASVRVNKSEQQERDLRAYNITRNDPMIQGAQSLAKIVEGFGWDPQQMINPQPPKPGPEPPKVSLSFKGDDLSNPAVLSILQQYGIQVDPQAAALAGQQHVAELQLEAQAKGKPNGKIAPPPHGGAVRPLEPIDKHDEALTGERSGRPPLVS